MDLDVLSKQSSVSSREIARAFDKRHDNVLIKIDNLKRDWASLVDTGYIVRETGHDYQNFNDLFKEGTYKSKQRGFCREVVMVHDGFMLIASSFTGKRTLAQRSELARTPKKQTMAVKTEDWNGHSIRFVDVNGEWMAFSKDATDALDYVNSRDAIRRHVDPEDKNTVVIHDGIVGNPRRVVITEGGIYDLVAGSHLPEAKKFKHWTHDVIKGLRQSIGLRPTQVFTMMDVEHQKAAMAKVGEVDKGDKISFINANKITNKAVANLYGLPKSIAKRDMTPEMLVDREKILDEVVELMTMKEKYGLDIKVNEIVYSHQHVKVTLPVKKGETAQ